MIGEKIVLSCGWKEGTFEVIDESVAYSYNIADCNESVTAIFVKKVAGELEIDTDYPLFPTRMGWRIPQTALPGYSYTLATQKRKLK